MPARLGLLGMKILIVDDHALIRDALRGVLKKLQRGVTVLEASDSKQAMEVIAGNADINLILLDLTLPDRDGLSVLAELRERYPDIGVVVLSALQDHINVTKVLDLGASGFIPKSAPPKVMETALQLIFAGGVYIPAEIRPPTGFAEAAPQHEYRASENRASANPQIGSPADFKMSQRQLEVLALIMQGHSNKAICRWLNLAEPTVKNHVTALLRVFEVLNRTALVVAVNKLGWTLPMPPKASGP
jgi:DNA-binding NarL/FixJ family response regulator